MITSLTWPLLKPGLARAAPVYHKFSLWPVTAKHPAPILLCVHSDMCLAMDEA